MYKHFFVLLMAVAAFAPVNAATSSSGHHRKAARPPALVSINLIDRNGFSETICSPDRLAKFELTNFLDPQPYEKVLRVYAKDQKGTIRAFLTSYHQNGLLKQYLEVSDGRAFGSYREYFPNGAQKIEAKVISGVADITEAAAHTWLFDGESKAWNEKHELEAVILYSKGELQGKSVYYHPNGNIWKTVHFNRNKIEGDVDVFLENGQLLSKSEYKNGFRHGKSIRYWDKERIASEEIYTQGVLTNGLYYSLAGDLISRIDDGEGTRTLFTQDGIAELQEYHEGVQDGEIKIYNKAQRIASICHMKDNLKHGEEIFYFDSNRLNQTLHPKISVTWYKGKIQGLVKTWYDDNTQESQKEMSENKKHGISSAWYRDGSLMLIEEYDRDKLVKGEYFEKGQKIPVSDVNFGKGVVTLYDSEGTFLRKINYLNGKPVVEPK